MKQTQTTEMPELSIDTLRQLAFMQYEGTDYFILNGKVYEGNEDEIKANHSEHNEGLQGADELSFEDYVSENCTEIEDFDNDDYLVLTDEEADEKVKEYIEDSLWAFNADFIIGECGLDFSGVDSLRKMQQDACEGANDFIRSLIDKCTDIDSFVEAAVSADGRGHFLSSYDGNENEETVNIYPKGDKGNQTFYIYRTN